MGAWGIGNFENDTALDWISELIYNTRSDFIEESIEKVLIKEKYLDYDDCCSALAASEIIASLRGNPPNELPEEAEDWIRKKTIQISEELTKKAIEAVNRIKEDSELKDLIEEDTEDIDLWLNTINDLISRLNT